VYQDLEDLVDCAMGINPKIERFDTSVFDGVYITGGVDDKYLNQVESLRNDGAKEGHKLLEMEILELHNQG
jgi:amidophosphoribosyltransferase